MSDLKNLATGKTEPVTNRRGEKVTVNGKVYTEGTKAILKDGSKVTVTKYGFGDIAKNPLMHVVYADGSKKTMSMSNRVEGASGASKTSIKDTSKMDKRQNSNISKTNIEADRLAQKISRGEITTKAALRNDPDYKNIKSGDIKNKLIRVLVKKGGDASYQKKEKVVAPSKYDKKGNLLKTTGRVGSGGVAAGGGGGFPIQIQEPLLLNKDRLKDERSMSPKALANKYGRNKFASGGMVNASKGAFVEVQNNFSDRMLPNKKRTTRIY